MIAAALLYLHGGVLGLARRGGIQGAAEIAESVAAANVVDLPYGHAELVQRCLAESRGLSGGDVLHEAAFQVGMVVHVVRLLRGGVSAIDLLGSSRHVFLYTKV